MSLDEKRPIEEKEAPKEAEQVSEQAIEPTQDAPLTKEIFSAYLQRLIERARAAGLSPLQVLAQTYAKRGMALLDGLLGALDNADNSKKKKE